MIPFLCRLELGNRVWGLWESSSDIFLPGLVFWLNWFQDNIDRVFANFPKASCTFKTDQVGESYLTNPDQLYSLVSTAIREVSGKNDNPEMSTDGGTSDARFIKNYCEVLELGLVNRTLHQVNEYVDLSDLKELHDIYLRILEKYFEKN